MPDSEKKRRKRRGPTRTFSTVFTDHSGYLAVVIGDYPEIESTVVVWYHNTIALYDGDDLRFGDTKPLKVHIVDDKQPKLYFDALCRLADFEDHDNLRDYIADSSNDPRWRVTIRSQLRQREYELGDLINFTSGIIAKLRYEVEDCMEYSRTPWQRFCTWFAKTFCNEESYSGK